MKLVLYFMAQQTLNTKGKWTELIELFWSCCPLKAFYTGALKPSLYSTICVEAETCNSIIHCQALYHSRKHDQSRAQFCIYPRTYPYDCSTQHQPKIISSEQCCRVELISSWLYGMVSSSRGQTAIIEFVTDKTLRT